MNIALFTIIVALILLIMVMGSSYAKNKEGVVIGKNSAGIEILGAGEKLPIDVMPAIATDIPKREVPINVSQLVASVIRADKINTSTVDKLDGDELNYAERRKAEEVKRMQTTMAVTAVDQTKDQGKVSVDVLTNRGKALGHFKRMDRDEYKRYLTNMRAERLRKLQEYRRRRLSSGRVLPNTKPGSLPGNDAVVSNEAPIVARVEGLDSGDNSCDCAAINFGPEWWYLTGAPQSEYINRGWYRL